MNKAALVLVTTAVLCALVYFFPGQSSAVGSGKVLIWKGGGAGQVVFSGKEHAEKGYGCDDCHTKLFEKKKGSAAMTMAAMNKGEFCGACHDGKTAFGTEDKAKCNECHGKRHRHHGGHDEKHEKDKGEHD